MWSWLLRGQQAECKWGGCAFSHLVLGQELREFSFSCPSPQVFPAETQADVRTRKGREGRRGEDGGKDYCNQSWLLDSIDPFLNMDVLSGTKFRAETHAKDIVGITASHVPKAYYCICCSWTSWKKPWSSPWVTELTSAKILSLMEQHHAEEFCKHPHCLSQHHRLVWTIFDSSCMHKLSFVSV